MFEEEEDLAALMEEPPGGGNHGRKRAGGWRDLETDELFVRSPAVRDDKSSPTEHGTLTAYFSRGCRCGLCRKAGSDWKRSRRQVIRTQVSSDTKMKGS